MIRYRPSRSFLTDSMKEIKEFNTVDEMKDYIVEDYNKRWNYDTLKFEDILIDSQIYYDDRIDWKSQYVCVKRIGNEIYERPICIGTCDMGKRRKDGKNSLI